jgi:hypothetical protein
VGIVSTVRSKWPDEFRLAANHTPLRSASFLRRPENRDAVLAALRIRAVESALYDAFGKGQLHAPSTPASARSSRASQFAASFKASTSSPQTTAVMGISSQQQVNGAASSMNWSATSTAFALE